MTEIETWLRDPYAIYARHVLGLAALKPLDEATDAADYGTLVHAGLHRFLREHGTAGRPMPAEQLRRAMDAGAGGSRAARGADGLVGAAAGAHRRLGRARGGARGARARRSAIATEVARHPRAGAAGGLFRLTGRADRIERRRMAAWRSWTTRPARRPSQKEVDAGLAPQLLLEAAMAEAGRVRRGLPATAAELIYWHLTGGFDPGERAAVQGRRRTRCPPPRARRARRCAG